MVFGALIDGLNVALHLKDLWQSRTSWINRNGLLQWCCWFLLFWSRARPVQEWEFSLRGALWATSPPPAEVVVDRVSQTLSEDKSHFWNIRNKENATLWRAGGCVHVVSAKISFYYLTSSKNLSSSRAGNCESLWKAKKKWLMAELQPESILGGETRYCSVLIYKCHRDA